MDKAIIIISTSESAKAQTGIVYAINALKMGWMEDIKLVFWGPAETLLTTDETLQSMVKEFHALEETAIACKFIAEQAGLEKPLEKLGVSIDYVGDKVSNFIKDGYVPMVW